MAATFPYSCAALLLTLTFTLNNLFAQSPDRTIPIQLPFALQWGEPPANLQNWILQNQFITDETQKPPLSTYHIRGPFPNADFQTLRVTYLNQQLAELEIQFQNQSTTSSYESIKKQCILKALELKSQLETIYGSATLLHNQQGTVSPLQCSFIQDLWTDEDHSLRLAVFTANQKDTATIGITSLHYRWETLFQPRSTTPNPLPPRTTHANHPNHPTQSTQKP